MSLLDKLNQDLKQAMKEKDVIRKNVVILIKAALTNESKKLLRDLSDQEQIAIVQRELKQTKDALVEFKKSDRQDVIDTENQKIAVIESYLPKQLTKEEVHELLNALNIDKSMKMGDIIKLVKEEVKGAAEGKLISEVVKEFLN